MQKFKIELKTLGNIHIGNGQEISKFEYVYDNDKKEYKIIDTKKLFAYAVQNNKIESYLNFVSQMKTNNSDWNLSNFIMNNFRNGKLLIDEFTIYKLKNTSGDSKIEDIKCFVKDKLTNKPYIPGSTLKGIISNVIFNCLTELYFSIKNIEEKNTNKLFCLTTNEKKRLKIIEKDSKKAIDNVLKKVMACINISDSELIDTTNLCVSKIQYLNGVKNTYKSLNQKYEMIQKNTTIEVIIKYDNEKLSLIPSQNEHNQPLTDEEKLYNKFVKSFNLNMLTTLIELYYKPYKKYYLSKFYQENLEILEKEKNSAIIYIGAKTGFPTKTIYYQIDKEQAYKKTYTILVDSFSKVKKDDIKKISPICLKTTLIDGKLYETGAVQISFKVID